MRLQMHVCVCARLHVGMHMCNEGIARHGYQTRTSHLQENDDNFVKARMQQGQTKSTASLGGHN